MRIAAVSPGMSRASQRQLASWLNAGVRPPAEAAFPLSMTVGPFHLAVIHAPRDTMRLQRRLMEYELSHGIVWLHESLTGERLAQQFLKAIMRLIHKSAGCQTGCIEEAFHRVSRPASCHSPSRIRKCGSGSTACWESPSSPGHASACGVRSEAPKLIAFPRPSSLTGMSCASSRCATMPPCGIRSMAISARPSRPDGRAVRVLAWAAAGRRVVHEVTHAIHSAAKLRIRDTGDRFVSAQVTGWLQFVKHNPSAWMWLVATIREQAQFEPLALLS